MLRARAAAKRAGAHRALGATDLAADGRRPAGPAEADRSDLRLDVAAVLGRLGPDLRGLADALAGGGTVAAAARALGLPRTTAAGRAGVLRDALAGLGEIAKNPSLSGRSG